MKLTASQQRNLDAIYAAGGQLFWENFNFSNVLGGKAMRGLNLTALKGLVRKGLIKREEHRQETPFRWYVTYTIAATP